MDDRDIREIKKTLKGIEKSLKDIAEYLKPIEVEPLPTMAKDEAMELLRRGLNERYK